MLVEYLPPTGYKIVLSFENVKKKYAIMSCIY